MAQSDAFMSTRLANKAVFVAASSLPVPPHYLACGFCKLGFKVAYNLLESLDFLVRGFFVSSHFGRLSVHREGVDPDGNVTTPMQEPSSASPRHKGERFLGVPLAQPSPLRRSLFSLLSERASFAPSARPSRSELNHES